MKLFSPAIRQRYCLAIFSRFRVEFLAADCRWRSLANVCPSTTQPWNNIILAYRQKSLIFSIIIVCHLVSRPGVRSTRSNNNKTKQKASQLLNKAAAACRCAAYEPPSSVPTAPLPYSATGAASRIAALALDRLLRVVTIPQGSSPLPSLSPLTQAPTSRLETVTVSEK